MHLSFVRCTLWAVCCLLLSCQLLSQGNNVQPDTFVYNKAGEQAMKAFVFRPAKDGKRHPAILLFHGGAWRLGEASWMFGRAQEFATHGMVAIAIDYRLANNGLSPVDGVEDAVAAFVWTRAHAKELGIDPKRVAGYGVSAGGHLVASAALLPSVRGKKIKKNARPDALLLYSAALNMAHDGYFVNLMKGHGEPAEYSPSSFISKQLPATLVIQGDSDNIVLGTDAKAFHDEAVSKGAVCELFLYPGVGHLLTRNLKVQYRDFDPDPADQADAHKREDEFLARIGYFLK